MSTEGVLPCRRPVALHTQGKSTKMMKRRGPRTDGCASPHVSVATFDLFLWKRTQRAGRSSGKAMMQQIWCGSTWNFFSLMMDGAQRASVGSTSTVPILEPG